MAVVTLSSTSVSNANALPRVLNSPNTYRGRMLELQEVVAIASSDQSTSVYRLFRLRSSDRVSALKLWCGAAGGSCAAKIGLYGTNGGAAVVSPTFGSGASACFVSSQSLVSALTGTDETFAVTTVANANKRVWELLGFTTDPGAEYEVGVALTADSAASVSLMLRASVAPGN